MFATSYAELKRMPVYEAMLQLGAEYGIDIEKEMARRIGVEEGRTLAAAELLAALAGQRFPAIADWETLEKLCLEVMQLPDAETLQQRLNELKPR